MRCGGFSLVAEAFEFNFEENLKLESLHRMAAEWCTRLGLPRFNPATGLPDASVPTACRSSPCLLRNRKQVWQRKGP